MTFQQLIQMIDDLPQGEQVALVEHLQSKLQSNPALKRIVAEFESRKAAGAFINQESLYGKFANPNLSLKDGELEATLREAATAWENELDEL